jgi:hypothetical protein
VGALLDLSDHQIAVLALIVALASLAGSVLSIVVASWAISRSNKNSSAATLVTLYEGFRQAWQRFLDAKEDDRARQYQLSELMNLAELACAIYSERSFVGVTRVLVQDYLQSALSLLSDNEDVRKRIPAMFNSPETFKYIRWFLHLRRNGQLSKQWFPLLEPPTSPIPKGVA